MSHGKNDQSQLSTFLRGTRDVVVALAIFGMLLGSVAFGVGLLAFWSFSRTSGTVSNDPADLPQLLEKFAPEKVGWFPREVPVEATDVTFGYGSPHWDSVCHAIFLKYRLPLEACERERDAVAFQAVASFAPLLAADATDERMAYYEFVPRGCAVYLKVSEDLRQNYHVRAGVGIDFDSGVVVHFVVHSDADPAYPVTGDNISISGDVAHDAPWEDVPRWIHRTLWGKEALWSLPEKFPDTCFDVSYRYLTQSWIDDRAGYFFWYFSLSSDECQRYAKDISERMQGNAESDVATYGRPPKGDRTIPYLYLPERFEVHLTVQHDPKESFPVRTGCAIDTENGEVIYFFSYGLALADEARRVWQD